MSWSGVPFPGYRPDRSCSALPCPQARTKELERDLLREFQEREQTYHDEQLLSTRRLAEAEHRVAQLTSGEYP